MESQWVTGPAKNLIAFGRQLREAPTPDGPAVELSVVCFNRPSSPATRFICALREAGIPTYVLNEKHVGDPRVVPALLAIVRSVRPDIIQTHNFKSHLLVRLTGLPRRIPWISFFHGFTSRDARDRIYSRIGWWALRGAPHVVTVCRAFASELARAGVPPSGISVRHNIVQPFAPPSEAEAAELRARLAIPEATRIVLSVGRLSSEKGHIDLLAAIASLRARNSLLAARFVIVGEGPERDRLEQRTAELGIADCVLFAGHQDGVRTYYGLADALVLPSHSEGSPNVLLEAMAAGLPVVSTDAGGAAELVSDGATALVVPPRNPNALAAALCRLLSDGELARRLGAAAQSESRKYSAAAYCEALTALYREVVR